MKTKQLLTLTLFSILAIIGKAQPIGWNFAVPIAVTENSGSTIVNYQMRLTINTQQYISANLMQANGEDIRFGKDCAGNTLYNYWIESGINTTNTVIWVKIDTLFASQTRNIYMYYSNSTATPASAVMGTFFGPHSSTDSVASGGAGGVANSQRGFRFAPNEDLLVTAFGKREPNGTTRYITLFDFTTQAIVQQLQVGGPAAQYSYGNLANPIWLTQGTQYSLQLFQGTGDGYYFGTSSQIGQHLTYFDMKYCNSCTQNTFPTSTLTNYHYGYPDLWYFTKTNVSVPPTFIIGSLLSVNAGYPSTICEGTSVVIGGNAGGGTAPYTYSWAPATALSSSTVAQPTANPTITTTYTVHVTDAAGCTASSQVTVNVNSQPIVYIIGNPTTICIGDTVMLNGMGGNAYTWSTGDTISTIMVMPTATTTYTVIGTETVNGCSDTNNITINVNPLPVVSYNETQTLVCVNWAPITLTSGTPANGTYSGTAVTGNMFDPATAGAGTYSIIYTFTDVNGCTSADTSIITVDLCTGINSTNTALNLSVFPNPFTNELFILNNTKANTITVTVYNSIGDVVTNFTTAEKQFTLNTANFSQGIYFIAIGNGLNEVKTVKVIKQ
jgi:hypothetical protein